MFWTKKKVRVLCLLVLALLLAHMALTYWGDTQQASLLKRGDFASFYSAGMIVRQGLGAQLYDTRLLSYVENLYWPSLRGNYISFPYPPFVALTLSPFAYFPPQSAKLIFTLLMILLTYFAVKAAGVFAPVFKKNPLALGVFLLAFSPVSFGVLGSQFTALNMLLYAGLLAAYSRKTQTGDIWAGLCLGLWCFKPQYAAALIFFFLAARAWRIAVTALSAGAVYYVLGALVQGPAWPWTWIQAAGKAAAIDFPHNDFNMISIAGFFHAAGRLMHLPEGAAAALNFFSWILSAALLAGAGFLFWKAGNIPDPEEKRSRIQSLLEFSAPVLLLASPHALFYDLGICVIACGRYVRLETDRGIGGFILLTALAFFLTAFKAYLPLQPMIFYAAGALFLIVWSANIGCETSQIKGK